MSKFMYYLLLCSILLLNGCKEPNTMPKGPERNNPQNSSNYSKVNKKEDIDVKTLLTVAYEEEQKFNTLKSAFDAILENIKNELKKQQKQNIKMLFQDIVNEIETISDIYTNFMTWLLNNPQKKKELASDFTYIYDFLNEQRIKQSSNLTNEQLMINTINCYLQKQKNQLNSQCNDNNYVYNHQYAVSIIFHDLNMIFSTKNKTNEEIFDKIKKELLEPNINIANLIGPVRYEQAIIKTLNDSQRQGLDFLKDALNDEYLLYSFLTSNKNKIKQILEHIYSELSKCSGDNAKEDTFKEVIKNYFYVINKQKLDEFEDQVKSGC